MYIKTILVFGVGDVCIRLMFDWSNVSKQSRLLSVLKQLIGIIKSIEHRGNTCKAGIHRYRFFAKWPRMVAYNTERS